MRNKTPIKAKQNFGLTIFIKLYLEDVAHHPNGEFYLCTETSIKQSDSKINKIFFSLIHHHNFV